MAINLLSYSGDAGLGTGSNPNIPVSASPDTMNVLAQASRDFANFANQRDALMFRQKVNDRDELLRMIASDQVSLGNILPEYLPEVEKAQGEAIAKFKNWGGNFNDDKGFLKYKQAVQKVKDLATLAQTNTASIADIRKARAQEPLSFRQKQIDEFEKKELSKGLSDLVRPWQKSTDPNFELLISDIAGAPTGTAQAPKKGASAGTGNNLLNVPRETSSTNPLSPFTKAPDKVINYNDYLGRAGVGFLEPGRRREQQELLYEAFESVPAEQSVQVIESINDRLNKYNEQTKGFATPVTPLREGVDYTIETNPQTGEKKVRLAINTPDLAAKFALANTPGDYFQPGETKFDKNIGDWLSKQKQFQIDMGKLGVSQKRARDAGKLIDAKIKKMQQEGVDETRALEMAKRFNDNIDLGTTGRGGIAYMDDILSGYENVILSADEKGKLVNSPLTFYTDKKTGRPYLQIEGMYDNNGNHIDVSHEALLRRFKEQKKKTPNATLGEFKKAQDNYYRLGLNNGSFRMIMKDKTGKKIDANSIIDAYRNLNNINASGKYKTPLFEGDSEFLIEEE